MMPKMVLPQRGAVQTPLGYSYRLLAEGFGLPAGGDQADQAPGAACGGHQPAARDPGELQSGHIGVCRLLRGADDPPQLMAQWHVLVVDEQLSSCSAWSMWRAVTCLNSAQRREHAP